MGIFAIAVVAKLLLAVTASAMAFAHEFLQWNQEIYFVLLPHTHKHGASASTTAPRPPTLARQGRHHVSSSILRSLMFQNKENEKNK